MIVKDTGCRCGLSGREFVEQVRPKGKEEVGRPTAWYYNVDLAAILYPMYMYLA